MPGDGSGAGSKASGPAAARDQSAPGPWRIMRAVLPLPFVATIVVPLVIVAGDDSSWDLGTGARAATIAAAAVLVAIGIALLVSTVRLFASIGRGTLAPWDPPQRLVVRGPYRYLRHPMIFGVATILAGETLALASSGLGVWLACFVVVNAIYLPLIEEPALVRRFGSDYERYMQHVGRWLPRLRPWTPDDR